MDIDHPHYYNRHPSGVECINIIEWFNFNIGSAVKYIWRAGIKSSDTEIIERLQGMKDKE